MKYQIYTHLLSVSFDLTFFKFLSKWLQSTHSQPLAAKTRNDNEWSSDKQAVDNLYYSRASELCCGTPLGFSELDAKKALVKIFGGDEELNLDLYSQSLRLEIALMFRGTWENVIQSTFWPTHLLFNSMACMVVQKKAFYIQGKKSIIEISIPHYQKMLKEGIHQKNTLLLLVHELAFGPAFKQGVTPPSLYFQLAEDDLVICEPDKAKKYVDSLKGFSRPSFQAPVVSHHPQSILQGKNHPNLSSPFYHIKPTDRDSFDFITKEMQYQLFKLKAEEALEDVKEPKQVDKEARGMVLDMAAKHEYRKHNGMWNAWVKVPRTQGLKVPNHMSEVVPCNSCNYDVEENSAEFGYSNVPKIYNSFVYTLRTINEKSQDECNGKHRLPIFRQLSGQEFFSKGNKNGRCMPLLHRCF